MIDTTLKPAKTTPEHNKKGSQGHDPGAIPRLISRPLSLGLQTPTATKAGHGHDRGHSTTTAFISSFRWTAKMIKENPEMVGRIGKSACHLRHVPFEPFTKGLRE